MHRRRDALRTCCFVKLLFFIEVCLKFYREHAILKDAYIQSGGFRESNTDPVAGIDVSGNALFMLVLCDGAVRRADLELSLRSMNGFEKARGLRHKRQKSGGFQILLGKLRSLFFDFGIAEILQCAQLEIRVFTLFKIGALLLSYDENLIQDGDHQKDGGEHKLL